MFEFIQAHKKLVFAIAATIILVLLGFLYLATKKPVVQPVNDNNNGEANYNFLKQNISQQDKYLMILAKIVVEDYGTYSAKDYRGLSDLQNQSTPQFSGQVQQIINSIPANKDITTIADPDSINLQKSGDSQASLLVTATTTNNVNKTTSKNIYRAVLTKAGDYWLVDSIVISQ